MKYQLFTYKAHDRNWPGMTLDARWYDLEALTRLMDRDFLAAKGVDEIVANWSESAPQLNEIAICAAARQDEVASAVLDPARLVLRSPIRPGAIYAAGANYRDHLEAMGRAFKQQVIMDPRSLGLPPWHFLKSGPATLAGHREDVSYPAGTDRLDWEAELAVVIGRPARSVSVEDALDHVAGYMCANDLSARDLAIRAAVEPSSPFRFDWVGHKCFNGSCPLGPVLTPARFVSSPESLGIRLWLNGELRQDSNTRNHIYGVAEQIAHLSARIDLLPGDVILTGTPAGVGMESGVFLRRGDVLTVSVEGLGELETRIV